MSKYPWKGTSGARYNHYIFSTCHKVVMNNCDWLTDADTRACAHTSPRIFVFCSKLWPGIVNCQARKQQNFIYAFKKFFMASHSFNFPVILCEVIVRKSENSTASQEIPVKIQLPTIRYKQLNDSLQNI